MKACASFLAAKVAFEIPKSYEVKSREAWRDKEIPDALIDALFALFPTNCAFEAESLCAPHLLIVDVCEPLTAELIADMLRRINEVLHSQPARTRGRRPRRNPPVT